MARRPESEQVNQDEQLGEAIEVYLGLAEAGSAPDPEEFAARYPELQGDLLAALEGLALVQGLVGDSGHGSGPGGRLESGRRIAGYRIVGELGRGGMGIVYEAVHVGLDRPVALKVLGQHAAPDSSGRRRFLNEARTAAGLHHTHIVPVFDVGQVGGLCYYAMQRIEGSGLDRVVKHLRRERSTGAGSSLGTATPFWSRFGARLSPGAGSGTRGIPAPTIRGSESATGSWAGGLGLLGDATGGASSVGMTGPGSPIGSSRERDDIPPPFDPPRGSAYYRWVAQVGRDAAEALAHAHQRGIIHRDIKPSNLLVDGRGFVWVADFGLARRMADPDQTHHESLIGTPRYMSPEQARSGPVDARTDLYSLGATLYELLALRPPFEGRSTAELVEQITHHEPSPARQTDSKIPRDLETIVLKLLSKRRDDRYASADAVADDLGRFLGHEPVRARRISPAGRLWRFSKRHPSGTLLTTAAALLVVMVSTWCYVRVVQQRDETVRHLADKDAAMANLLRMSYQPGRREEGLGLIREAASLRHDPALLGRLRDEAVEFLILRDVEPRQPFATRRARSLAFNPGGSTLTTLTSTDEGEFVNTWNVSRREKIAERPLQHTFGPEPTGRGPSNGGGGGGPEPSQKGAPRGGNGPGPGQGRFGSPRVHLVPLGPYVAAVGGEGQGIRLFDAATGERLDDLPLHRRGILSMASSLDGHRLVTVEMESSGGSRGSGPRAAVVNLWDGADLDEPIKTLARFEPDGTPGPSRSPALVAISPDGGTVATARRFKSEVSLWSAETGSELGKPFDAQAELSTLALGPQRQLATAGSGEVRLWDIDARTSHSLTPNQSMVWFLRFSPRGSLLAVVGGRDIELWDTAAYNPVAVLSSASERIEDVAFAPDGHTLAACGQGENAQTQVWGVIESEARVRLGGFDAPARSLAFRQDGLLAISTVRGTIRFWSGGHCLTTGPEFSKPAKTAGAAGDDASAGDRVERPVALAFDDRGRLVTAEAQALRVWSSPPKDESKVHIDLNEFRRPNDNRSPFAQTWLTPALDGRTMLIGRGNQLALWRSSSPDGISMLSLPGRRNDGERDRDRERGNRGGRNLWGMTWWRLAMLSPTGDRAYFAANGREGTIAACDLNARPARWLPWTGLPTGVVAMTVSADGSLLAAWDGSGKLSLIDAKTGTVRTQWSTGLPDGMFAALAFSPDRTKLAAGAQQGHVDLWSITNPKAAPLRLPGHRGAISLLAFEPDGRYLASAGIDKNVDVWDLDQLRKEFTALGLAW